MTVENLIENFKQWFRDRPQVSKGIVFLLWLIAFVYNIFVYLEWEKLSNKSELKGVDTLFLGKPIVAGLLIGTLLGWNFFKDAKWVKWAKGLSIGLWLAYFAMSGWGWVSEYNKFFMLQEQINKDTTIQNDVKSAYNNFKWWVGGSMAVNGIAIIVSTGFYALLVEK